MDIGNPLRWKLWILAVFVVGAVLILGLLLSVKPIQQTLKTETTESAPIRPQELARWPMDRVEEIITRDGVTVDNHITFDAGGSLKIQAGGPRTVRLFETGDIDVENARLIYHAVVRSENLIGRAYLEMWCVFPGLGEFFSRGLDDPIAGDTDWVPRETFFFLKKGENPSKVKLNLVIEGKGVVWIDDVRLLVGPLNP
jgi:hypothetical protein